MAFSYAPVYASTIATSAVTISTANTAVDGTGNTSTLITGGHDGTLVTQAHVQAAGATTAGMIRFFHKSGNAVRLLGELAVTAATPSAILKAYSGLFLFPANFALKENETIEVTTNNAETFNVFANDARDY